MTAQRAHARRARLGARGRRGLRARAGHQRRGRPEAPGGGSARGPGRTRRRRDLVLRRHPPAGTRPRVGRAPASADLADDRPRPGAGHGADGRRPLRRAGAPSGLRRPARGGRRDGHLPGPRRRARRGGHRAVAGRGHPGRVPAARRLRADGPAVRRTGPEAAAPRRRRPARLGDAARRDQAGAAAGDGPVTAASADGAEPGHLRRRDRCPTRTGPTTACPTRGRWSRCATSRAVSRGARHRGPGGCPPEQRGHPHPARVRRLDRRRAAGREGPRPFVGPGHGRRPRHARPRLERRHRTCAAETAVSRRRGWRSPRRHPGTRTPPRGRRGPRCAAGRRPTRPSAWRGR